MILLLALALGAGAAPAAAAEPRSLVVENRTAHPIFQLYVEPVAPQCWCEDVLGEAVIAPAGQVKVRLEAGRGCRYDPVAVLKDGTRIASSGADLCATHKWVVGPGAVSATE
jgi:hypothetical protein